MTIPTGIADARHGSKRVQALPESPNLIRLPIGGSSSQIPVVLIDNRLQFRPPVPSFRHAPMPSTRDYNNESPTPQSTRPAINDQSRPLELLYRVHRQTDEIAGHLVDLKKRFAGAIARENQETIQSISHDIDKVWNLVNAQANEFKDYVSRTFQMPTANVSMNNGNSNHLVRQHDLDEMLSVESDNTAGASEFECSWGQCTAGFDSADILACHVFDDHLKQLESYSSHGFICEWKNCVCHKRIFTRLDNIREHLKTVHIQLRNHKCPFAGCGKYFKRRHAWRQHMIRHVSQKPYKCTFEGCPEMFSSDYYLKKHVAEKHAHTTE